VLSYGIPNDINTTTGGWGVNEQWIYKKSLSPYDFSAIYVYLDNDKVTSYQDF
jgi:hypothetical protein